MMQMIAAMAAIHSGSRFQRHSVTPGKSDDSPVFPPAGSVENGGLTGDMMFLQAF
jgi:hypothetical protein